MLYMPEIATRQFNHNVCERHKTVQDYSETDSTVFQEDYCTARVEYQMATEI